MLERRLTSSTELAFIIFVPLAAFTVAFLCMLWFLFYASNSESKDTRDAAEYGMQAKDSLAIERVRTDYSKTDYTTGTEYPDSSPDRSRRKKACARSRPCDSSACSDCQKRKKRSNRSNSKRDTKKKIQDWWRKDFDETAFDTMSIDRPDGKSYDGFYDPEVGEAKQISELYSPSIHSETSFPEDEISVNRQSDEVSTLDPGCGSTMPGESLYTPSTGAASSIIESGSVHTSEWRETPDNVKL